ncbi:MAG: lytic transglycosylase domain-containing protein [Spirochaetota bacterium]
MPIYKIILIISVFLFITCSANAVETDNLSKAGFYSPPDRIIQELDNKNAGYREHFLLGVAYKKKGEPKKAILHFANSCFQYSSNPNLRIFPSTVYKYVNGFHIKSEYYNDSVYEIAALFFEFREFEYVIKFTSLINKSGSALYRDLILLKSNASMELGKYDDVISLLKGMLVRYDDVSSRSIIQIRIASAYERKEDTENAVAEYFNVLRLSAKTWQSGIACERIQGIVSKTNYELKDNEKVLLIASLYHNAKYREAAGIAKSIAGKELSEPLRNDLLKYAVRNYVRSGNISETENLISSLASETPVYHKLLKAEADELWIMKKKQPAYNIYQKLSRDASDDILKHSRKRVAQYLIANGSGHENILLDYIGKYPKDKTSQYFFWILARNKLKEKDTKSAIKYMEDSLSAYPYGAYSGRCRFWLVKLYGRERKADALQRIKEMAALNPDSAYTWKTLDTFKENYKPDELQLNFTEALRAKNYTDAMFYHTLLFLYQKDFAERDKRISAMDFNDTMKKYKSFEESLADTEPGSKYKYNLKEIEKYFRAGYSEGISRELAIIPNKSEFRMDKYRVLAQMGGKYNNYNYAAVSVLKLLKYHKLKENISVLSAGTIAKLFPAAFKDDVEKLCGETEGKIPAEMVYAVMKTESTFNHKAVSSAGAVGLMQLMPATAKDIAKGFKIKEFDLKEPSTSIKFGVNYLAWLSKFFKADFEAMMAGYNAGAGNVKKWLRDFNADDDYLIEFIPFEETRSYILRTGKFLIQYRLIYNNKTIN